MTFIIRFLLAAFFLLPVSSESPAQAPGITGGAVAEDCANYPDSQRPRNCELFASSMVEIVTSEDSTGNPRGRLCVGKDVPVAKIIGLINQWLAEHPEMHAKSGYDAAHSALANQYRCR